MITVPLSHRLRADTKAAHTTAERSGIMRDLLRGTITIPAYIALLNNLAALYEELEAQLSLHADHAALRAVNWSLLRRHAALQNDVRRLTDSVQPLGSTATTDSIVPSTHAYVARLRELGELNPTLLFAHAYLRYLGDMYGGQIIKRIVLEKMLPEAQAAVSFYEFDAIENLHAFMVTFRESLDAIPLSVAEADDMVKEAQLGYELHARIFEELEARQ